LRARIAASAPAITIEVDTRTAPLDQAEQMRSGDLDLSVDWVPAQGERFVQRRLFEDHLIFIARAGHPRASGPMSQEAVRRESFVRIKPRTNHRSAETQRLQDEVDALDVDWALTVSEFLEVPYIVLTTDLLGYISGSMGKRAFATGLLKPIELPVSGTSVPIFLMWHETRRADEGHRWLREVVATTILDSVAEE
jgi:DNA-binding transcriptional LysR family regulator